MTVEHMVLLNKLSKRYEGQAVFLQEQYAQLSSTERAKAFESLWDRSMEQMKAKFFEEVANGGMEHQPFTSFTLKFVNIEMFQAIREKEKNDESQIHHPIDT